MHAWRNPITVSASIAKTAGKPLLEDMPIATGPIGAAPLQVFSPILKLRKSK
jgi:hypothetical protein